MRSFQLREEIKLKHYPIRHAVLIIILLFAASWLLVSPVSAASSILVDTTADVVADDGLCSLREAIYAANNNVSYNNCTVGTAPYTIEFAPALPTPATFTLTLSGAGENAGLTGDLDIKGSFSVAGAGAGSTIIDGNGADRVLHVLSTANVTISGVTIRNGNPGATASGGGIAVENSGRLTLNNAIVSNNTAVLGAGLWNVGATSNTTIVNSRISSNIATADGGGISNYGILDLKRSTIDGNQADTGAGIDHQGLSFKAQNSTISGNTASDNGGGIANQMSATLTNVTLTGNSASGPGTGGNLFNDGDSPQIIFANTIVANPGPGGNCANTVGALNSSGHNVESTNTCNFSAPGDQVNTDPLLGPLQDNGGPTPTHALLPGSPAIDQGDDTKCPDDDQRGVSRPADGDNNSTAVCDSGAFELESLVCGITASTVYDFGDLSLTITDLGTDLGCLRVTNLPHAHPNATEVIQTDQYWNIDGFKSDGVSPATADYVFNLTLPHSVTPQLYAHVCKYPGTLSSWDCTRADSTTSLVWSNGITGGFSDWAVGRIGPNALTLNSFSASSAVDHTMVVPLLFSAFIMLAFTWLLWRKIRVK